MWGFCVSVVEGGGGVGVQFFRVEVKWRNLLSLKCALSARNITRCKDEIFRAEWMKYVAHGDEFWGLFVFLIDVGEGSLFRDCRLILSVLDA